MMPTFAVNQFTTMPQTFEQDLELYQELGVEGIEVCTQKLASDTGQARGQLRQVRERGLTVTSVQPAVHSLFADRLAPDPRDPEERVERFRGTIDLIAEALPEFRGPLVTIGGAAPRGNLREAWRLAERVYPELADYAAERDLSLAFEPIHPILMNEDTFVCSLEEANGLVERVDRANFGLVFDVWHLWAEPDLARRLERIAEKLLITHLSDWARGGPRGFDDRAVPGEGVIDLAAIFGMLERAGYRGDHVLEILSAKDLSDSLWRENLGEVIRRSRSGLRQAGCPGA